ncbi:MAG: CCA tRNA nucleotidyltransferase [Bosea sp. (in: a-proteobacteria)]
MRGDGGTLSQSQKAALATLVSSEPLASVLGPLNGAGEEARIVGGAVRNTLLGLPETDIDIATTCLPEETIRRAEDAGLRAIPTGIEHGTITIIAAGKPFEVTTLREDIETDGRHAKVRFGRDFSHDAARRDFTINALMLDADGGLHDDVGGLADLAANRLRFIGEAASRIREDYLRILRFFRFHAAFGAGAPDAQGLAACIAGRDGLDGLSRERIRAELIKLVSARGAVATLRAMSGAGLWQRVTGGLCYPDRLSALVHALPDALPIERLAAASVLVRGDADRLRERLRLSNAEHELLASFARTCEALHGQGWPDPPQARTWAHRFGLRSMLLALVCESRGASPAPIAALAKVAHVPPFPFSGRDMIAAGIAAGPQMGVALARAERLWIEADFPTDQAALTALIADAVRG